MGSMLVNAIARLLAIAVRPLLKADAPAQLIPIRNARPRFTRGRRNRRDGP
jgi:hypothetical protein